MFHRVELQKLNTSSRALTKAQPEALTQIVKSCKNELKSSILTYDDQYRSWREVFNLQIPLADHAKGRLICPRGRDRDVVQGITGFFAHTDRKAA